MKKRGSAGQGARRKVFRIVRIIAPAGNCGSVAPEMSGTVKDAAKLLQSSFRVCRREYRFRVVLPAIVIPPSETSCCCSTRMVPLFGGALPPDGYLDLAGISFHIPINGSAANARPAVTNRRTTPDTIRMAEVYHNDSRADFRPSQAHNFPVPHRSVIRSVGGVTEFFDNIDGGKLLVSGVRGKYPFHNGWNLKHTQKLCK
jgi:hypothetical protein